MSSGIITVVRSVVAKAIKLSRETWFESFFFFRMLRKRIIVRGSTLANTVQLYESTSSTYLTDFIHAAINALRLVVRK